MGKRRYVKAKKSDIVIYIDKQGKKRWKWRSKKGAIYGK